MCTCSASHFSFHSSAVCTVIVEPLTSSTSSPTSIPVRISGPLVSSAIATGLPSIGKSTWLCRALAITSPWYSYEPWEKFMRTMFMPASRSLVIISTLLVLGPMVQMMEHLRKAWGSE